MHIRQILNNPSSQSPPVGSRWHGEPGWKEARHSSVHHDNLFPLRSVAKLNGHCSAATVSSSRERTNDPGFTSHWEWEQQPPELALQLSPLLCYLNFFLFLRQRSPFTNYLIVPFVSLKLYGVIVRGNYTFVDDARRLNGMDRSEGEERCCACDEFFRDRVSF